MSRQHTRIQLLAHASFRIDTPEGRTILIDPWYTGNPYLPDIAILPIGDRFTMGPLEAAFATRLLKVKHVIPCHYGTMPFLTGTPERLKALTQDIVNLEIHALKAGETLDTSTLRLKQW